MKADHLCDDVQPLPEQGYAAGPLDLLDHNPVAVYSSRRMPLSVLESSEANAIAQKNADHYTQTIFNCLFFLYSVQKRGFLDGNPHTCTGSSRAAIPRPTTTRNIWVASGVIEGDTICIETCRRAGAGAHRQLCRLQY